MGACQCSEEKHVRMDENGVYTKDSKKTCSVDSAFKIRPHEIVSCFLRNKINLKTILYSDVYAHSRTSLSSQ